MGSNGSNFRAAWLLSVVIACYFGRAMILLGVVFSYMDAVKIGVVAVFYEVVFRKLYIYLFRD